MIAVAPRVGHKATCSAKAPCPKAPFVCSQGRWQTVLPRRNLARERPFRAAASVCNSVPIRPFSNSLTENCDRQVECLLFENANSYIQSKPAIRTLIEFQRDAQRRADPHFSIAALAISKHSSTCELPRYLIAAKLRAAAQARRESKYQAITMDAPITFTASQPSVRTVCAPE
jgi:hypothetical protein